jgi:hypothetical protein
MTQGLCSSLYYNPCSYLLDAGAYSALSEDIGN